jgi:hypothetical protein
MNRTIIQFGSTEQAVEAFLNDAQNHSKGTRHNNNPAELN